MYGKTVKLITQYKFVSNFFTNKSVNMAAYETHLYSVKKTPRQTSTFIVTDIRQYVGMLLYMSLVNMPNKRSYWSNKLVFPPIQNTVAAIT